MATESRTARTKKGTRVRPARRPFQELMRAAEAGTTGAADELAQRFLSGNGVARDEVQALHWFSVGAHGGDADAQNNLGTMLLNGIGCAADATAAVPWYRASAEQGNAVAQFNLGLRYLHGDGAEQDDRTAGDWIALAAVQGHVEATGQLGTLFRYGRGTEPDLLQAAQLHLAAAEQGDATSHDNLAEYRGALIEVALTGCREAAFDLCRMYERGLGVPADAAWCWGWIRFASRDCGPMPDDASRSDRLDEEVETAFGFFRMTVEARVRKLGEARLRELRKQGGLRGLV